MGIELMGTFNCIVIILVSLFSSILSETINWLFIYRTDTYRKLTGEVRNLNERLDKHKDKSTMQQRKKDPLRAKQQKLKQIEDQLKEKTRQLSTSKFKTTFFMIGIFSAVVGVLSTLFDGTPIGKLPFIPIKLLHGISHRNLLGTDFTDCSFLFLYILSSLGIRPAIQKLFGNQPRQSPHVTQTTPWG